MFHEATFRAVLWRHRKRKGNSALGRANKRHQKVFFWPLNKSKSSKDKSVIFKISEITNCSVKCQKSAKAKDPPVILRF